MPIYSLTEIEENTTNIVGGKAYNLAVLLKNNYNVPRGFVCTDVLDDEKIILKMFDKLELETVAVRSSAICEDSNDNSFAGQFETILNVDRNNLIASIKQCFESSKRNNVIAYANERGVNQADNKICVIVQEMIQGEASGVMFTNNPINGQNEILIECVKGLGEKLVQGEETPAQILVSRDGKIKRYVGEKIIDESILKLLCNIGSKIEKLYQKPQDIEWTLTQNKIYVLQTRPITGYSS